MTINLYIRISGVCITRISAILFREDEGRTPLWYASNLGDHNLVKLLLKEGAKVERQDLQAAIEVGNE